MLQTKNKGCGLGAAQHMDNVWRGDFIPHGAKNKSNTVSSPLSRLTPILLVLPQLLESHL